MCKNIIYGRTISSSLIAILLFLSNSLLATVGGDIAVEVSARVQDNPAQITLVWKSKTNAGNYTIYRRTTGPNTPWGTAIATPPSTSTSYVDTDVAIGIKYEYKITRGTTGIGYITAGIKIPLNDNFGKVIFLTDNSLSEVLKPELHLMEKMMVADGWQVIRRDVSPDASVVDIKTIITDIYKKDPQNTKALYLFGDIAVPYSGKFTGDGHYQHTGAWPADVFYGDIDGAWTDNTVYYTSTDHDRDPSRNYNTIGDGKYDQNMAPSAVELEVGRVDLANMPAFKNSIGSEVALLRNYINKNYKFRYKEVNLARRAVVYDGFEWKDGTPSTDVYREASAFFGQNKLTDLAVDQFMDTLASRDFLWAHAEGGGWFEGANGVGSTANLATTDPKAHFYTVFGSWFGDWDTPDNFLRAFIATKSYGLTNIWAASHHWFAHNMALGANIGYAVKTYHNNTNSVSTGYTVPYIDFTFKDNESVHIGLMGDPTLRLHPVAPVSKLSATTQGTLTWAKSTDTDIVGYHVYKAQAELGVYKRITNNYVSGTSFTDPSPSVDSWYMVRAIKLETSGSGTYYNASQGIITQIPVNTGDAMLFKLYTGWNLLSFPTTSSDMSINSLFAPILDKIDIIKTDSSFFDTDRETYLNNLTEITAKSGYLIKMKEDATLYISSDTVNPASFNISLRKGWNLIGYPYTEPRKISSLFSGISEYLLYIKSYDGFYDPNLPLNEMDELLPKNGYFIEVSENCILQWE